MARGLDIVFVAALIAGLAGCGGGSKSRSQETLPEEEGGGYEEIDDTPDEVAEDQTADIQEVFVRKQSPVARCYTKRLEEKPDLERGEFVVEVELSGSKATKVVVKGSSWRDNVIEGCIAALVKSWTFPSVEGSVPFSFTYVMDKF